VTASRASAFYSAEIAAFLATSPAEVLGRLVAASGHDLDAEQNRAWQDEIEILRTALADYAGWLYLEFDVPRLGSRIDAVVISGPAIFPLEFKCGEREYRRADFEQAWDYALDLKNFHQASHQAPICPVLIATDADQSDETWPPPHADDVRPPIRCNAGDLGRVLRHGLTLVAGKTAAIDGPAWGGSPYEPTPTIIEAARALYARHSVEAISRHDAGATNLKVTSAGVEEVIERSRAHREKSIVFLTGVPGAGKTLVGLNVATRRRELGEARAVFLSGNGPLVSVLQEALTKDEFVRMKGKERKGAIRQKVKPFIQNIHHFRDEGIRNPERVPYDHVAIFDEAQRAWTHRKLANFMKSRKGIRDFPVSEPHFLISYLDRHRDWAVVICLVGGGQEIHEGEAGIALWLDTVRTSFPGWRVCISPHLTDSEYAAGHALDGLADAVHVDLNPHLHLASSMRSFRSEKVSAFVKAVLDCDVDRARDLLARFAARYPIAITRDLDRAKRWIRERARGSERYGLVASSSAERLKPHAVDVRVKVDPVQWFLNDAEHTRSSFYLEDAATEFQVQGLELDWICMTWDADLRLRRPGCWEYKSFRGKQWQNVKDDQRRRYLLNAYRVLLTRARQGMVIFVPPGDADDPTRQPEFYDGTFNYLQGLGLGPA
jgi:hypothetical protein